MKSKALSKIIKTRKSVRSYNSKIISSKDIKRIVNAGLKAPSGKNGQPWKFIVIQNDKELFKKIAEKTIHDFILSANCFIMVYLDKSASYHYVKDVQAIGACIQNMLLTATSLNIGSCWIGEILNKADEVNKILDVDNNLEFMALISLGYPNKKIPFIKKKNLKETCSFY